MILLDTHVAIWLAEGTPTLGQKSFRRIEKASGDDQLAISAVSIWEVALLIAHRRLKITGAGRLADQLASMSVRELPLTGSIGIRSVHLLSLPNDPADRFIVATAIAHNATLMTADEALLGWKHNLPRLDARQ